MLQPLSLSVCRASLAQIASTGIRDFSVLAGGGENVGMLWYNSRIEVRILGPFLEKYILEF